MDNILAYVKVIEGVEVNDDSLEYNVKNIWREDKSKMPLFSSELIIKQFPDSQDNFVKVKKIL
jgi:Asp-tRNA(Asn)/Glu-tRNA(Gln) amidotransferase C subunit